MILKTLATGSTGNCYILTANNGKHLILDAGIQISEIKKGLEFDIENVEGCVITHSHGDHSLSTDKISNFCPVWKPYLIEAKRQRTHLGCFKVECFDVPHSVPCRGFIIEVDGLKILYATDFEYIGYSFKDYGINAMLIEMNYQQKIMDGLEVDEHVAHVARGHASDTTTTEFILHNKKYLQSVTLCHYSKSGNMNREEALTELKGKLPAYIELQWAIPGQSVELGCPF